MNKKLVKVVVKATGKVLADRVEIAETWKERSKGLLGRNGLNDGEGMIIRPCSSIHTFFMKFPIDVVFLDKSLKILKISSSMPSWRISGCLLGCTEVIELKAGAMKKAGVSAGEYIKFE